MKRSIAFHCLQFLKLALILITVTLHYLPVMINFIISLKCVQVNSLNINRNSLKEKLDLSKNCVLFLFFVDYSSNYLT